MPISIIELNGRSPFINYDQFEEQVHNAFKHLEAKVFIYNKFPAEFSPSAIIDILLIVVIKKISGNYFIAKIDPDGRNVYFFNKIIPIKYVDNFEDSTVVASKEEILIDGFSEDFQQDVVKLKYGFQNYLVNRCGFVENNLFIDPLIFVKNKESCFSDIEHVMVGDSLSFNTILSFVKHKKDNYICSYNLWNEVSAYDSLVSDISRLTEQAALDSEYGYLTKKKIDRLSVRSANKKMLDHVGTKMVIVNGKAGSGKTTELLGVTSYSIRDDRNVLYLTYNRLLVYDISKLFKSLLNRFESEGTSVKEVHVTTLHSFFRALSKTLRILNVISAKRIEEILRAHKKNMRTIFDFLKSQFGDSRVLNFSDLRESLTRSDLSLNERDFGLILLRYLEKKKLNTVDGFVKESKEYYYNVVKKVVNINNNQVFLADYHHVLELILAAIKDPSNFFYTHDIASKLEIFETTGMLANRYIADKEITVQGFEEFTRRRIGGRKNKRIVIIDEAQDCNRIEKDILIHIFGSENIVIANGGKEQLIRHMELCNWKASEGKRYPIFEFTKRKKTYRMKKNIVDLCNFIAERFNIELAIEVDDSVDTGKIVIDFQGTMENLSESLHQLKARSEVYGCTPYEGVLLLLNSGSQGNQFTQIQEAEKVVINEFGNVILSNERSRGEWLNAVQLKQDGYSLWNGTTNDKSRLESPQHDSFRYIFYESCRGLEAWCVLCFALDTLFDLKNSAEESDKFLATDLLSSVDIASKRRAYAANWVLMAMTRAIDTLHIRIENPNSELGLIMQEYITAQPHVKVIR